MMNYKKIGAVAAGVAIITIGAKLYFNLGLIGSAVIAVASFFGISFFLPKNDSGVSKPEGTHGSADWAGKKAYSKFLGADKKGFTLGKIAGKPFRVLTHIVSCAPTRSGKGVGAIIPALLEHPGSVIVHDIKGENWAVTHRQRANLGSRVCLLDPFGMTGGQSARFNWLDFIDIKSPDCVAQAAALADLIIVPDGNDGSNHFDDSAKNLIQGLILFVATLDRSDRNMASVRAILTLPEGDVKSQKKDDEDGKPEPVNFLSVMYGASEMQEGFGIISRCCSKIIGTPEKERGSIISTAQRHTAFLDDPRISEILSGSDFDLSKIKEQNLSIYIVLPPDKLRAYRSFARGFFGLAMSAITANQKVPEHKVLFLLDEFGQLGHMAVFEDGISLVAGYGAALWFFIQDLSQLKGVYKKWQTFLANSTRQFFGCTDFDTAKYISDSLGSFTELVDTGAETDSFVSRKLLNPDEVMKLPPERPIVFMQGESPFQLDRLAYFKEPEYKGLYDQNPFFQG